LEAEVLADLETESEIDFDVEASTEALDEDTLEVDSESDFEVLFDADSSRDDWA